MLKVFGFDLFGTLIDMDGVDTSTYKRILDRYREEGIWSPFFPPDSWKTLPAFPEVSASLLSLRHNGAKTVILSNCPMNVTVDILRHNRLIVDGIIPLETIQVYKTDPKAYALAASLMGVLHEEFAMVTGNRTFGDLEAAHRLGMKPFLIRDFPYSSLRDLNDLVTAHQYGSLVSHVYRIGQDPLN